MPSRPLPRVVLGVAIILAIPLTLTLLNSRASLYGGPGGGWDWMPGDFVAMGVLLFATGMAIEYAAKKFTNPAQRTTAIAAIILTLLIVWVELAVDGVSQLIWFLVA